MTREELAVILDAEISLEYRRRKVTAHTDNTEDKRNNRYLPPSKEMNGKIFAVENKEEYYYRSIFEEHFPSESAARSVPSIPSVACSTAEALTWDTAFKNLNDPSGRAVKGIHVEAY